MKLIYEYEFLRMYKFGRVSCVKPSSDLLRRCKETQTFASIPYTNNKMFYIRQAAKFFLLQKDWSGYPGSMLKAKVNKKYDFILDENSLLGDGTKDLDIIEVKPGIFHIIKDNKSFNAEVLKANKEEKNFVIRVNGNKYTVQLKDKYDDLLKELGIENNSGLKVEELKAPMPGMVVDVRVKENDLVKKDDALIVLQAMKMENILKSPVNAGIKKIHVRKGDTVEKNQPLVSFT